MWQAFILVGSAESRVWVARADSVNDVVVEILDKVGEGGHSIWTLGAFAKGLGRSPTPAPFIGDEGGDATCAGR